MAVRPTAIWREGIEEEARLVAAGVLEEEFAVTARLFPQGLLSRMDEILEMFERDASALRDRSDEAVLASIRRVVVALNSLNDEHNGDAIATSERDLLCAYIDEAITEAGVDLDALCSRHGMRRDELTDGWRTW
jgi:hypothetical protein